eukprot:scaffold2660_cov116-Skeletonema_dohrnii-CCMP3373.AAC.3
MNADGRAPVDEVFMCASCGITEGDDINLKDCGDACKLVRYCSDACEKEHRPKHEQECEKQVAELRDELLFKQCESYLGECPICLLPLLLDPDKNSINACCSKIICSGCRHASGLLKKKKSKCPFCRHPVPESRAEADRNLMKRIKVNDPIAMRFLGMRCYWDGDYITSVHYLAKATQFGDAGSHYQLAIMYEEGNGVERDEEKRFHHLEEAAIGGHAAARNNLGGLEWKSNRKDRAVKHWIIAANLGHDSSVKNLRSAYLDGQISKENFAMALRAYQAAANAAKSPQRDEAERDAARVNWNM